MIVVWREIVPPLLSYTRGKVPPSSLGKRTP
jgi:hypothetical protein